MREVGNFFWFLLGGAVMGLAWWLTGVAAFISVVGIPWAKACMVIGQFSFLPFGKEAINRKLLQHHHDIGTGNIGKLGNIIWFIFAGIWLALGHLLSAIFCVSTIIGIPFAIQHLKLARVALFPIGQTIVSKEVAIVAKKNYAERISK